MIQIFLIAISLAMDAFTVAVSKGLQIRQLNFKILIVMPCLFGLFQAIMPIVGWLLAAKFAVYITSIDHWIAFTLLILLGAKFIYDASTFTDFVKEESSFSFKEILLLAIATSIDALAIGVSFAFANESLDIYIVSLIIGIVTFVLSVFGVYLGFKYQIKHMRIAPYLGGIILILLAFKILQEHIHFL